MKKQTREPAQPTTGELINRLSHERLMLYRQGAGRPMAREVRARLVELIRELDRLWEQRRQELASAPFPVQLARAHAEVAAQSSSPQKPRTPSHRESRSRASEKLAEGTVLVSSA